MRSAAAWVACALIAFFADCFAVGAVRVFFFRRPANQLLARYIHVCCSNRLMVRELQARGYEVGYPLITTPTTILSRSIVRPCSHFHNILASP